MKHHAPDAFKGCSPLPAEPAPARPWRQRLSAWWSRRGWDRAGLPETLLADVVPDHPRARPVRGRAAWERRL